MKNIDQNIYDELFRKYKKKLMVNLRLARSKSATSYDPDYDVQYTVSKRNAISIVCVKLQTLSSESLIFRNIGLTKSGAIDILVKNKDVNFIKLAERITLDNVEYTPYHEGLGNRVQITDGNTEYSKVTLFRKI